MTRKIYLAVVLTCVASLGSTETLSKVQRAEITKAGLTAYVPSLIPKGFKLKTFAVEKNNDKLLRGYSMHFIGPKGAEFTIQGASDGLGDAMFTVGDGDVVDPTSTIKVPSKVLGTVEVELFFKGKERQFHNQWKATSGKLYPRNFMIFGSNLSEAEIKNLYKSLVAVK